MKLLPTLLIYVFAVATPAFAKDNKAVLEDEVTNTLISNQLAPEVVGAGAANELIKKRMLTKLMKKGKRGKSQSKTSKGGSQKIYDAVVVGSGVAGLTAARKMESEGLSVKVLEALPRVGGRSAGEKVSENQSVDFGGQWIGISHQNLIDLVEELDLRYFKNVPVTNISFVFNNTVLSEGVLSQEEGADLNTCQQKFLFLVDQYPDGTLPWDEDLDDDFKKYDEITVSEWVRNHTSTKMGELFCTRLAIQAHVHGSGPSEAEVTSMLFTIYRQSFYETSEYYLIHGGAFQIPKLLARKLKEEVALDDPVVAISQHNVLATIQTLKGKEYKAKNVIVATAPHLSGRILYKPALPWNRYQLTQHRPIGTVAKILIEYPSKFWDDNGLLPGFITIDDSGFVSMCIDSTDDDSDKGHLVCLITSKSYDRFAAFDTFEKRKNAVLAEIERALGPDALEPTYFEIGDWPANPHTQGCYGAYWPPQAITRFGSALIEPHGVIQWAGTDSATMWAGYYEGAIISGKLAAQNVIEGNTGMIKPKIPSGDFETKS